MNKDDKLILPTPTAASILDGILNPYRTTIMSGMKLAVESYLWGLRDHCGEQMGGQFGAWLDNVINSCSANDNNNYDHTIHLVEVLKRFELLPRDVCSTCKARWFAFMNYECHCDSDDDDHLHHHICVVPFWKELEDVVDVDVVDVD